MSVAPENIIDELSCSSPFNPENTTLPEVKSDICALPATNPVWNVPIPEAVMLPPMLALPVTSNTLPLVFSAMPTATLSNE